MRHEIIIISGKQGSGKTTLAKLLNATLNRRIDTLSVMMSFADILYEMHDAVRDVGAKYGIERVEPKDGPLLQLLGTEWGRNMDQNIWVKGLKAKLQSHMMSRNSMYPTMRLSFFIIPDCRFANELDAFPNAFKIRLECDRDKRRKRVSMWRPNDQHPSETDLDKASELGLFDAKFDTGVLLPETIQSQVIERLGLDRLPGGTF